MHVEQMNKTKIIAVLGVMAALSTVLTVLGTVISVNTVFFTAMAAFLVGIVRNRYGTLYGSIFYAVCAALDFLCNPNPFHVLLYLVLAGYLLLSEILYVILPFSKEKKEWIHRAIRFVLFAICYIPLVVFMPQLFLSDKIIRLDWFWPLIIVTGIVAWIVYDIAYGAFKSLFFSRFRKLL